MSHHVTDPKARTLPCRAALYGHCSCKNGKSFRKGPFSSEVPQFKSHQRYAALDAPLRPPALKTALVLSFTRLPSCRGRESIPGAFFDFLYEAGLRCTRLDNHRHISLVCLLHSGCMHIGKAHH